MRNYINIIVKVDDYNNFTVSKGITFNKILQKIFFVEDSWTAHDLYCYCDYHSFLAEIPNNITTQSFEKLPFKYHISKLYDNIPSHITHISTSLFFDYDNVYPRLTNLPACLKKLKICKVDNRADKSESYLFVCPREKEISEKNIKTVNHNIKLPHECVFEYFRENHDNGDIIFKVYISKEYKKSGTTELVSWL